MSEFNTLVVDDASTDTSVAFIRENFPQVQIISLPAHSGFAKAANVGIEKCATPYIALLNVDTQVYPDWLSRLVARLDEASPDVGAINSQMLRMDDQERIDDAGDELSWYGAAVKHGHGRSAAQFDEEKEIFSPCAGATLYRRDFLIETGGFDPDFFAYLEDVDLGLRGRLIGYRYLYLPKAKVLHKGHGSKMPVERYVELITRNRLLIFAKNIPVSLLLRHGAQLLYGQVYFLIAYRRPWSSLRGYAAFLASLPAALRKRRKILAMTAIDARQLDAMLSSTPPQPPLSALARAALRGVLGRG